MATSQVQYTQSKNSFFSSQATTTFSISANSLDLLSLETFAMFSTLSPPSLHPISPQIIHSID